MSGAEGRIEMLVIRPGAGRRETPEHAALSPELGVLGDRWVRWSFKKTPEGRPHPDMQISLISAQSLNQLTGGDRARWPLAGDNLVIDMDLGPEAAPEGTRLRVGTAEIEITAEPHLACTRLIRRFGRGATRFLTSADGRREMRRGRYARVVAAGHASLGDPVRRVGDA